MSRDNLYSIFFIDHIFLVLLEVLYEDFKCQRIFAGVIQTKRNLAGVGYTGESGLLGVPTSGSLDSLVYATPAS